VTTAALRPELRSSPAMSSPSTRLPTVACVDLDTTAALLDELAEAARERCRGNGAVDAVAVQTG
jgi:hypothetical protein